MNGIKPVNSFYKTFTPFITPQTRTAEKTIKGQDYVVYKPPSNLLKKFYGYISAGGFLLLPILGLVVNRRNLAKFATRADLNNFRATYSESNGLFVKASKKITEKQYGFAKKTLMFLKHYFFGKEDVAAKLNDVNNKGFWAKAFRGVNSFFKKQKINAFHRQSQNLHKKFDYLEKVINSQIDLIEKSASGKLKIAFPKELLKDSVDDLPKAVDLSKMANGKSRAEEARKILSEIKTLLKENPNNYAEISKKISYTCDEVFKKSERTLSLLNKSINLAGVSNPQVKNHIQNIYSNLIKYRYAEILPDSPKTIPQEARRVYINNILDTIKDLKKILKNPGKFASQFDALENVLSDKNALQSMGLIEKLRSVLKCNDIRSDLIKDNLNPSLFKYHNPDEYIKMKDVLSGFAKDLKKVEHVQKTTLPSVLTNIDKGKLVENTVAAALPVGFLAANYAQNPKTKEKRNLASYLVGTSLMFGSNFFTNCSFKISILLGLAGAFLTSRFFKTNEKNNS